MADISRLKTALPPNSTSLQRTYEQMLVAGLAASPLPHRQLWNPNTCPAALLPWLAWTFGVEGWRSEWSEQVKRARIKAAIDIHRRKGTLYSVRRVVESFGGQIALREWWQTTPRGRPHTFELVLTLSGQDGTTASAQFVQDVVAEVQRTKPLRSHFTFVQGLASTAVAKLAAIGRPVAYARLDLPAE